ncbi:MAG TPA: hypothetical protein VF816_02510 [Rhodocyclaceae bacterium]
MTNIDDDAQKLERNVKRATAISALRKIRHLVDQSIEEDAAAKALSRRLVVGIGVVLLVLALAVMRFGLGPIARWIAGAVS